ncbi:D-serine/D-alanine/glycine transporter [Cutibacterium acnes JCM 18918]|nr:D-serine/D-alanine/glycine transporter [Cutibacterium acnes JCM 18918]
MPSSSLRCALRQPSSSSPLKTQSWMLFSLVAGVSSVLYLSVWGLILVCYLKYLGKHPQRHAESAFKMPAGRVMSWVGILFFITILIMLGFSADSRQALSPLLSG